MVQFKNNISLKVLSKKPQNGRTFLFCCYIFKQFQISSIPTMPKNRIKTFHILFTQRPHSSVPKYPLRLLLQEDHMVHPLMVSPTLPQVPFAFLKIYRAVILHNILQLVCVQYFLMTQPRVLYFGQEYLRRDAVFFSLHPVAGTHVNLSH